MNVITHFKNPLACPVDNQQNQDFTVIGKSTHWPAEDNQFFLTDEECIGMDESAIDDAMEGSINELRFILENEFRDITTIYHSEKPSSYLLGLTISDYRNFVKKYAPDYKNWEAGTRQTGEYKSLCEDLIRNNRFLKEILDLHKELMALESTYSDSE